jgi:hypothetical protein
MARVFQPDVEKIIDVVDGIDFSPFITAASLLVDRLLVGTGLSDAELKELERWLAAHFLAIRDPRVRQRSIGDSKETYAISGGYKGGLDATPYGQQAMVLDWTGTLMNTVGKKAVILDAVVEEY